MILYNSISFFKAPSGNVTPSKNMTLKDVAEYIKSDAAKRRTAELRAEKDKDKNSLLKRRDFDYVTFSGTFKTRKAAAMETYTNLVCFDFDHVEENFRNWLKMQLIELKVVNTALLFTSPNGDGLKWVVVNDFGQENHKIFYDAMENYLKTMFQIKIDKACSDISRACFLPHDPSCYLNPLFNNSKKQISIKNNINKL